MKIIFGLFFYWACRMNVAMVVLLLILVGGGAIAYIAVNYDNIVKPPGTVVVYLEIQPSNSGSVLPDERYFLGNEIIHFVATPASNYVFNCWLLDGVNIGTASAIDIPMNNQNHNLKVTFNPSAGLTTITGGFTAYALELGGSRSAGVTTAEGITYILTVNQQKIWAPNYDYSFNGYAPHEGSLVRVTGYISTDGSLHYLEVVILTPS